MSLKHKLARFVDAGPGSQRASVAVEELQEIRELAESGELAALAAVEVESPDAADALPTEVAVDADELPHAESSEPELFGATGPIDEARRNLRLAALRRQLDHIEQRTRARRIPAAERPRSSPGSGLPGELRRTDDGDVQVVRRVFDLDHRHGNVRIADAHVVDAAHLAGLALDERLAAVAPARMVLVDTETTGLMGGTGTLAFVVGLAWFEDGAFVLEQLLLRSPGEEGPLLGELARRLRDASLLVTYNGKSFDWPLLRARFILNRITPPEPPPHLDLLHCARRVYKRRLPGRRLVTLESDILGFERLDDVDGALIPQRYFDYLRGADGAGLAGVVEHNGNDLLALAGLLAVLAQRYAGIGERDDARDRLSLAEVALRGRDPDRALTFARAAAGLGREDPLTVEALLFSARLLKRRGEAAQAAHCLLEALPLADGGLAAEVHLALAKLYERELGDTQAALAHAHRCESAEASETHARRLARLDRRARRFP